VQGYLLKHNRQEILDQAEFARLSGVDERIELINDAEFNISQDQLLAQDNVQDMMKFGLRCRAGTLLNKDAWQIDRFSLQYKSDRDGATDAEKRIANTILPHVAKALRIGRPLNASLVLGAEFGPRENSLDFGMCLLSPKGFPIATNVEFDRIVAETSVFRILTTGQLALAGDVDQDRFKALISGEKIHGAAGANPRRQSLFFPLREDETGVFVEICPVSENEAFGRLPPNTRLVTALDATTFKTIGSEVVSRFFPLSKSEEAVLTLIGAGRTNREIADERSRSLDTVNSQVKSLLFKTHTRNRTELVQLALSLAAPFGHTRNAG